MMSRVTKILPSDVTCDIILPKNRYFWHDDITHDPKILIFAIFGCARVARVPIPAYSGINFGARAARAPKIFSGGFAALVFFDRGKSGTGIFFLLKNVLPPGIRDQGSGIIFPQNHIFYHFLGPAKSSCNFAKF